MRYEVIVWRQVYQEKTVVVEVAGDYDHAAAKTAGIDTATANEEDWEVTRCGEIGVHDVAELDVV